MTERSPVLVLGLGNELFTDEGVGVVASRRLAEKPRAGVEIVDGGTLGLALLPEMEGREAVLILDAVAAEGASPGEVMVLDATDLDQPFRLSISAHQLGISEALAAARLLGKAPERVAAIGMVPFSLETGYGLSPGATSRLEALVAAAEAILRQWGVKEVARA